MDNHRLASKAIAACEVEGYWGDYVGDCAYLLPYKTTRHGQRVTLYRWISSSASAYDISGAFTCIHAAMARANRCPWARNVTNLEAIQ